MFEPDYTYKLDGNDLYIIDEDFGNMSVTNSIEKIVKKICSMEKKDPKDLNIVYRDSDQIWDGWDYKTKSFIALHFTDSEKAM